jgi:hypothetical protein
MVVITVLVTGASSEALSFSKGEIKYEALDSTSIFKLEINSKISC